MRDGGGGGWWEEIIHDGVRGRGDHKSHGKRTKLNQRCEALRVNACVGHIAEAHFSPTSIVPISPPRLAHTVGGGGWLAVERKGQSSFLTPPHPSFLTPPHPSLSHSHPFSPLPIHPSLILIPPAPLLPHPFPFIPPTLPFPIHPSLTVIPPAPLLPSPSTPSNQQNHRARISNGR
ncbi:hypothetical protein Pcinc_021406 [Petrolisthes cinctipes]|uniref:Uncharacterized protein n=1 Tax=Petrolisthes cinctipes TaxID=88211 RepID=A0AAE1FHP6_PETCI|nr:hypothetical protein Pcinc_021406 [Petrolisthes cinctipes]